jgi:hypothetical protein
MSGISSERLSPVNSILLWTLLARANVLSFADGHTRRALASARNAYPAKRDIEAAPCHEAGAIAARFAVPLTNAPSVARRGNPVDKPTM